MSDPVTALFDEIDHLQRVFHKELAFTRVRKLFPAARARYADLQQRLEYQERLIGDWQTYSGQKHPFKECRC